MSESDEQARTGTGSHSQPSSEGEGGAGSAGGRETATGPRQQTQQGLQRTRTSGMWAAVAVALVVLLFLLIFILQNLEPVTVTYFGAGGQLPLGVALLLGAVGGALFVVVLGVARILQLRRFAWRQRRQEKKAAQSEGSG